MPNNIQRDERANHTWPDWYGILSNYQTPSTPVAVWQLVNTLIPYGCLWFLMLHLIRQGYPYAIVLAVGVLAAAFLVRIFILFHDCVHGSLFPSRVANTLVGYLLGVLVFTPFADWRFSHLRHHATYADLDARGFGDVWTLTRTEYNALSNRKQCLYRLYRKPVVLFGLGALFCFLLFYRFPTTTAKRREYSGVLLTNLLLVIVLLTAAHTIGLGTYLLIQLPVLWMAGAAGVWLFYVQHQFDGVYWARRREWNALRAAMEGSSFYDLPAILRWFSGNIGYHHVHHLGSRIPNYRLKECYEAFPELQAKQSLTVGKSFSTVRLKLWDEERKKLVGFR